MNVDIGQHQTLGRWRSIFDLVATALMIVTSIVLLFVASQWYLKRSNVRSKELPPPSEPLSLDGAVFKGNPAALVALIEYSDFQCPTCGKFARESLPEIERQYVASGRVLLAFRHYPIALLHPLAVHAAEAAACAGLDGKFWQMHGLLFQDQEHLDATRLHGLAAQIGLQADRFDACMGGRGLKDVIQNAGTGVLAGVDGTPTLFVGRVQPGGRVKVSRRISGGLPPSELAKLLDDLLREAR